MQKLLLIPLLCCSTLAALPQLAISNDQHYIIKKNGKPFFWLGDTAWELFHRLNREEAIRYLDNRAAKGFTVIQAVILAELDGLNTGNAYGNKPLLNNDPGRPNEAYFRHVDFVIREANKRGLIMALLPSWGDKWNKSTWGMGPEIFTPENAEQFGNWLGKRYHAASVVWVLGGDRDLRDTNDTAIIRNMAKGLKTADPDHLLSFHPAGGHTSSEYFGNDDWIGFHMSQTGHKAGNPVYRRNTETYALSNSKPHVDAEPNYEDHPNDFKPLENGWLDDADTREAAYWNMLSGGAGHTYGNHNIWQMFDEHRIPVNNARRSWSSAMDQPGAFQMGYMKKMMEKRPWQRLRYDPSKITDSNQEGLQYKVAAVSRDSDFMMIYIPYGTKTVVNTSAISSNKLRVWWFNPRDGHTVTLGEMQNTGSATFTPTSVGRGSDWVLIIDDAERHYPDPNAMADDSR